MLPLLITGVSYFDNEYRGDLVVTRGVLYYFPWVNVAKEQKDKVNSVPVERLFPFDIPIELARIGISAYREAHTFRLKQLGLWQDGQTDDELKARLDAYIAQQRTQEPQLVDYEFGLPHPMRFAATEIKNMSLKGKLTFDTAFDNHDFEISIFEETELLQALKEAGFAPSE